jgi:hypothetical protein
LPFANVNRQLWKAMTIFLTLLLSPSLSSNCVGREGEDAGGCNDRL